MGIIIKENKKSKPVPAGIHPAVCVGILDLGTQYNPRFENYTRKVLFTWELPQITITVDGEQKPRRMSRQYTLSLHKKAKLREVLESWRGRAFDKEELSGGFDLVSMLSANCQLQVIHGEGENGVYATIKNVLPLPKDQWTGPSSDPVYFSFDDSNTLPELPDWIKKIVEKADEWQTFENLTTTVAEDIPF